MSQPGFDLWTKARRARDQLIEQFLNRPEVTLIDIGYDLRQHQPTDQLILRVHVRQPVDQQALGLPQEVDGLPVQVVVGDYHLQ